MSDTLLRQRIKELMDEFHGKAMSVENGGPEQIVGVAKMAAINARRLLKILEETNTQPAAAMSDEMETELWRRRIEALERTDHQLFKQHIELRREVGARLMKLEDARPEPPPPIRVMHAELTTYLDSILITTENIGVVRRRCMVPWDGPWNSLVLDETAARENGKMPTPRQPL